MARNDLTTLARVKTFLGITSNDATIDLRLQQYITRMSATVLQYLSRDTLLYTARNELLSGSGNPKIMLPNYPVLSIESIAINTLDVPVNPTPPIGSGFWFEPYNGIPPGTPQLVLLAGYAFTRGTANIAIGYTSGYAMLAEPAVVPATPFKVTPLQTYGIIAEDIGVTYADGTPLVAVASAPATGQYVAPKPLIGTGATDYYTFSLGDVGADVLLSYSYIPDAIEGAVVQWLAEQWQYKDRIGVASKTLGGQETISYIVNDIPKYIKLAIASFRNFAIAV
jgi:hypothetical protein